MIDEKLEEFFNRFPYTKENRPLQSTLSKKTNSLTKKEIQHDASQVGVEQKALLSLIDLDTLLSQLKNLEETDYSKCNDLFAKIFGSRLVSELNPRLNQIDEIHPNYRLNDILVLPTNSSNLTVHDLMFRDIGNLHSMVKKVGNALKITQGPRKLVGIFKNKTLLFLPKSFTDFLTTRSQSGDVCIDKVINYYLPDVTVVPGDLLLAHSKLKRAQVDLELDNIAVSSVPADVFYTNAHSGTLTSDHACAKEETPYHTSSGNIDLDNISTKNFFIDTKSGKIIINDLNSERMDLTTGTGNMSLNNIKGSGDIRPRTGKINLSIADKSNLSFSIKSGVGSIRVNVPRTELPKSKTNTKKTGPTDLPLDSIIYGNNEYDEIEGCIGDENPDNSLIITSEIGKVSIKD